MEGEAAHQADGATRSASCRGCTWKEGYNPLTAHASPVTAGELVAGGRSPTRIQAWFNRVTEHVERKDGSIPLNRGVACKAFRSGGWRAYDSGRVCGSRQPDPDHRVGQWESVGVRFSLE